MTFLPIILTSVLVSSTVAVIPIAETSKNFWLNSGRASIEESLRVRNIVEKAKNVIIFIGDGMSIPTITASRILKGQSANHPGEETIMSWEKFPHVGLAKTYNVDSQVPDSAGTGTAFLSGVKTRKGMINVDASVSRGDCSASQGHELDTILRWSLDEGKSAGVVTTTRITHATPAASYASVADRGWEGDNEMSSVHGGCKDIAKQLVEDNKDIQVLMGGGRHYFYPNGHKDPENGHNGQRQDGRNLIEEWQKEKATRGVSAKFVWNSTDLSHVDPASTDYLLGLFGTSHLAYSYEQQTQDTKDPTLAEMTEKAIQILQKNNNGFFLLVEGGNIDHGHHAGRAFDALHDTLALEQAVAKAASITNEKDTLILVSADHAHTMTMAGYPARGNPILGVAGMASDSKYYTTLLYGTGPGHASPRHDASHHHTMIESYHQDAAVPTHTETHGGDDVAVYARGPYAHLLTGVHEQNYLAHVMAFASCVGPYKQSGACSHDTGIIG